MLPETGVISFRDINIELGKDPNSPISLNDVDVRALAGISTGTISLSNFRKKYRELAQVDAYLYNNTVAFNTFLSSFVPPTPLQIFNTWGRFAANAWYPNGSTPSGDAAAWVFNSTLNRPECTLNTASYTGFVSNEKLGDFTLEATLSSTHTDDDVVGLIGAFKNDGTKNIGVLFTRTCGGLGNEDTWQIKLINGSKVTTLVNGSSAITIGANTTPNSGTGWKNSGGTRVRIQKVGNILTGMCSPFGSSVIDPSTAISFDLNSNAVTQALLGKQSYGYLAFSQYASTFTNIVLTGSLEYNKAYNIPTNEIKQWNSTNSVWDTISGSIANSLGYPRKVYNPNTAELFFIDPYGVITKIS